MKGFAEDSTVKRIGASLLLSAVLVAGCGNDLGADLNAKMTKGQTIEGARITSVGHDADDQLVVGVSLATTPSQLAALRRKWPNVEFTLREWSTSPTLPP
jgi:hypothetical protein